MFFKGWAAGARAGRTRRHSGLIAPRAQPNVHRRAADALRDSIDDEQTYRALKMRLGQRRGAGRVPLTSSRLGTRPCARRAANKRRRRQGDPMLRRDWTSGN